MVVALLGVGADGTNTVPTPPVYQDGTFEYIPIPEREGPEGTIEDRTYGNTDLRQQEKSIAEYVDSITPQAGGAEISGDDLVDWPFHYDPNFDDLTYGESTNRGSYAKILRELERGDIVAFYTGLQSPDSRYTDRYIIGYFTVDTVLDLQNLPYDDEIVSFSELPREERDRLMGKHCENAHAKRYFSSGQIAADDGLIIVDGRKPVGLLDRAFPISQHTGGGHHYLIGGLENKFSPDKGGDRGANAYLGGIKQPHRLNISSEEFIKTVGEFKS